MRPERRTGLSPRASAETHSEAPDGRSEVVGKGWSARLDDLGGHDPDAAGVAPLEHDRALGSELDVRRGDHQRATLDVIDAAAVADSLDDDRDAGVDARGDDRRRGGEAAAKLQHHAVSIGRESDVLER